MEGIFYGKGVALVVDTKMSALALGSVSLSFDTLYLVLRCFQTAGCSQSAIFTLNHDDGIRLDIYLSRSRSTW